ncbi:MAG: hypothetical protein K2G93_00035 [Rikenella sp.]|nr:hypothetical protein [Rikenella sp.]
MATRPGIYIPSRALYPAPGWRDAGSRIGGTLYSVGGNGYGWASSVTTGTNAYYLGFNYGGISPNSNSNRALGLQLRCLQE